MHKQSIVPVFIPHAGCPHRCIFCNQTPTTGCRERFPGTNDVKNTIEKFSGYIKDPRRPIEIAYYGGNFLGLEPIQIQTLLQIAAEYVHAGRAQGIRFSTRPDTIDPAHLELLSPFPVSTVELGVQSMNDRVLEMSRRGHTARDTRQAVSLLKPHPYQLGLQMMVGLPGDSDEGAVSTARQLAELAPDFVRIYPTLVLQGSPLARLYAEKRYKPLALEHCVQLVKTLYLIFHRRKIPVIRMGLQPTLEINHKAAVKAGPFHPAFGELVHAAVILDLINDHLSGQTAGPSLEITVHPRRLSQLKGHRCGNIDALRSRWNPQQIEVRTDAALSVSTIMINGRTCRLPV